MSLFGELQTAVETWLSSSRRSSRHTARAYEQAVTAFAEFVAPIGLGQVGGADVERWANALTEAGYQPATVNARLAALSSFYEFCRSRFTKPDGQGLVAINPVAAVNRQRVQAYGHSNPLEVEQIRMLLESVDRSTVAGARDYAMLLMLAMTGRRSAEVRELRVGNIRQNAASGCVQYHWRGKGGAERWDTLPTPAYDAIIEYLVLAERDDPGTEEFVFAAASGDGSRALSGEWLRQMVSARAVAVGLPEDTTVHALRHTAAMLRMRTGADIWDVGRLLGHSSPQTTRVYTEALTGYDDQGWPLVMRLLSGQAESWLDVIDEALCRLSSTAPDLYDNDVQHAHGVVQGVLSGVCSLARLAEQVT